MKKHIVMFGVMAAGAAAVIGKRTYDIIKLRKDAKREEVETEVVKVTTDEQ